VPDEVDNGVEVAEQEVARVGLIDRSTSEVSSRLDS
jgi:hypothetical protein